MHLFKSRLIAAAISFLLIFTGASWADGVVNLHLVNKSGKTLILSGNANVFGDGAWFEKKPPATLKPGQIVEIIARAKDLPSDQKVAMNFTYKIGKSSGTCDFYADRYRNAVVRKWEHFHHHVDCDGTLTATNDRASGSTFQSMVLRKNQ